MSAHKNAIKKRKKVFLSLSFLLPVTVFFWFNSMFPLLSETEESNALGLVESAVLEEESYKRSYRIE